MKPLDLLDLRLVGQPRVSPDGSSVAFVEAWFDADADTTAGAIFVRATDGSGDQNRLTAGPFDSLPTWSPDGRRIAFLTARTDGWRKDLWVVDVRTAQEQLVCSLPRGVMEFAWSPDGATFLLLGLPDYPDDPARPTDDPELRRARYLERPTRVTRLDYRAPGGILDDEAPLLWTCAADGGDPKAAFELPHRSGGIGWAPDGRYTFLGNLDADPDLEVARHLYAASPDIASGPFPPGTDEFERLSNDVGGVLAYTFGPDGTMAYTGFPDADSDLGHHEIHVFVDDQDVTRDLDRTADRALQSVTLDYLVRGDGIAFADDGDLYFPVNDAGTIHLYRLRDGAPEPIVDGPRVLGDWDVAGGTLVFTSSAVDDVCSLRSARPDGADERLLHAPNQVFGAEAVGSLEQLPLTVEGEEIDAWLALPPDHEPGRPLPTVLMIHPGPCSSYGWDWNLYARMFAGAGYACLFANPPGSQGYGEAFAKRVVGAWGSTEMPTIHAICDRAIELGIADPDRIGLFGLTSGGHTVLWAIAHADRFAAAVAVRPVANFESCYGSMDVGHSYFPAMLEAEPWQDPDSYRAQSPVQYVEQIDTPLRLIAAGFPHNFRNPAEQSEQMFTRLRKLRREVDLVYFHGDTNSAVLPGRPWNRVRFFEAILEWYDTHL